MATERARDPAAAVTAALTRAQRACHLGAFWSLDPDAADALAPTGSDDRFLAGIPVAVKDMLDVAGLATSAGLPGEWPPASVDSEAVRRLRGAGAVPIGKTAMDPLGCTTGGQAPGFPPCLNPIDPALSPGGSSSGSAVAVAAGIVPLAVGTDTAGSVRVPAAYTGIVGFKPARREIPRRGCVTVMPGFDTIGVLARSVAGCIQGYRAMSARRVVPHPRRVANGLRVGALSDLLGQSDGAVVQACSAVLGRLQQAGVGVERLDLGWYGQGLGAALAWELASNWGERVDAEPTRFPAVIRETIAFGRSRGAEEHERALASFARARRRLHRRVTGLAAVVSPTAPIAAPDRELESTEVSTRFTRIFSALGWPAFSLPVGTDAEGRPIGIQAASPPAGVEGLIEVARRIEEAVQRKRHT